MILISTSQNYSIFIDSSGALPLVEAVLICSQADYQIKKEKLTKQIKLETLRFTLTLDGAESLAKDLAEWIVQLKAMAAEIPPYETE